MNEIGNGVSMISSLATGGSDLKDERSEGVIETVEVKDTSLDMQWSQYTSYDSCVVLCG